MKPEHKRAFEVKGWPFVAMSDVVALGEEAKGLVREVAGETRFHARLGYGDHDYSLDTLYDLHEAAGLPPDGLVVVNIDVNQHYEADERLRVNLAAYRIRMRSFDGDGVKLEVSGANRTAVEGITVQLRDFVNRAIERRRQAELQGETIAKAQVLAGASVPETEPQSTWRRVTNNLWTITIVGGIIAIALGGVFLALLI